MKMYPICVERRITAAYVVLAVAAALGLVPRVCGADQEPPTAQPAAAAPQFKLKDLSGAEVSLSDFKDQPVIVAFWASWDEPSRRQMVILAELQKQWQAKKLVVLGLSLDKFKVTSGATNHTNEASVKAFAVANAINFPILFASNEVITGFGGLKFLPTIFVLDPRHIVVAKHEGVTEKSALHTDLKAMLGPVTELESTVANP